MKLIDLTHPLRDGQLVYPGDPLIRFEPHGAFEDQQFNLTRIQMGSHSGTHLDAPFHFFPDGRRIDEIPLDRFVGPAVLIDLAPGAALPPGTLITPDMLQPHAAAFSPGARILYRTGWSSACDTPDYFTAFPSLTREAAQWIADRRIALLGMDCPSPSHDATEVHRILLRQGTEIVILESLVNLDQLPERFTLIALPLKLAGLDGAPTRAVALVDDAVPEEPAP